jgi:hypothetical protein
MVLTLAFSLIFFVVKNIVAYDSVDYGGDRGWALAFSEAEEYASILDFFPHRDYWPTLELTGTETVLCDFLKLIGMICTIVTSWIRFTGLAKEGGVSRNCVFTIINRKDSNHVQPFFLVHKTGTTLQLSPNIAKSNPTFNFVADVWNYWTKFTFVYKTNGENSTSRFYFNDTLMSTMETSGHAFNFSDGGFFALGAYASGPTNYASRDRFIGWIDDLAFYSYAMTDNDVKKNWNTSGNTSNPYMIIYYNFDEGPNAEVITNHGQAGSVADLYNGKASGGYYIFDLQASSISRVKAARYVSVWNSLFIHHIYIR